MQTAVATLTLGLVLALPATAGASTGIGIARPEVGGDGALVAPALSMWLEQRVQEAGLDAIEVDASSQAAAAPAAELGLGAVLLPHLHVREGKAELQLVLLAPETGTVLSGSEAKVPLEDVGLATSEGLVRVLSKLGLDAGRPVPPTLDELVSTSRALTLRAAGAHHEAYRAVQGKLSPLAMALREELAGQTWDDGIPVASRARLMAASGDPAAAWRLLRADAAEALADPAGDPQLLVAAGEVSLARGDEASARRYFEAAIGRATGEVQGDAQLGLARIAILQGRTAEARDALTQAVALRPDDPRPAVELSRLEDDPEASADHLVEAGRRAGRRLDVERARRHLRRARELSAAQLTPVNRARAELETRVGRPDLALEALDQIPEAERDATTHLAAARAHRDLGDHERAVAAFRSTLAIEPGRPEVLRELGRAQLAAGRPADSLATLREAEALEPSDPGTQRAIARALQARGDVEEALQLQARLAEEHAEAGDLHELAHLQLESGDTAGARASLDRAVALRPFDPEIRARRAEVLEAVGSDEAAREAGLVAKLRGVDLGSTASSRGGADGLPLEGLVQSFAVQIPNAHARRIVSLGVRYPGGWRSLAERLLHPRRPDVARLEGALDAAVASHFDPVEIMAPEDAGLGPVTDQLYAFDSQESLSAAAIAQLNGVLGIDGVILTQLDTRPQDREEPACAEGDYEVRVRLLAGDDLETATILANGECLAGGHAVYGTWNYLAFFLGIALAALILYPIIRGWGTLHVSIQVPQRTKGFFSIHINERPDMVVREVVDKNTMREKTRSKRRFDLLRRFERHMAGSETPFRWIPVRKTPYTVTVAGPLMDAKGDEIIGHFFQEQPVRAERGRVVKAVFDLRPQECAIEITLKNAGVVAAVGRCALRGDPSSVRYARDGMAYLYVGLGSHTVVAANEDSAVEIPVEITSLETSKPILVDFADDAECAFRDCPEAVEPFVLGDLPATVEALTRAGQENAAHRLRAALLHDEGRSADAAAELEAAGETLGAAELRAHGEDFGGSAELFERAGDFDRAADAYRAAGRIEEAARCYEQVFDYANALECWRELGDSEREMILLEKTGDFMEAAIIAHELGDPDRALTNLQQIDQRHVGYPDACDLIANIMLQRGDVALALAKFEEALSNVGVESVSLQMLERYADTLEQAGRTQEALSAYEAVARRDVTRGGVNRRIETLRQTLARETQAAPAAPAASDASTAPLESRYELIEEIGRGGMGVVYKARDTRLGRVVALKRLPENLRDHPNAVALFEREARAAASLNHGNIVTLFDAGEEGGSYFITMELLQGQALDVILHRVGQLSARDTARIGIQICAGLQYAHEQRIVHRDIKTSNLFFTKDHKVKIMDFGIAKSLEEVRRTTTVVGGTPYYMAPEQAAGDDVDHRADLYALGVTLFQLATGSLPFPDGDVTYRHRHEEAPDAREFAAALPDRLAAVIKRLLAKTPEERPDSASAVAAELQVVLREIEASA